MKKENDLEYNKQIGTRIKKLREDKDEYQKQTAEAISKTGISLTEGQLGLYEIGARKLPPNIIKALATHFGTTTDYILGRDINNEKLQIAASMKDNLDLSDMSESEKKYITDFVNMMRGKKK
ncbi:MAG: helix-turn-helix transcriptional regulator [Clostridia bacterium]|nr:helix-turn-helix transcriptional regulator [Clostridia bacterium]